MTDHERIEGRRADDHEAEHWTPALLVLLPLLLVFVEDCVAAWRRRAARPERGEA